MSQPSRPSDYQPEGAIAHEYLTAEQVSHLTGFSSKSLEAMRHTHRGPPFFKVGKRVRYRAADVRAWMEAGGPVV
jgi:predicted DNA-binding transcriptional regulator AlpA